MQVTLSESYLTGTSHIFLYILSLIAVFCSIYIIISKNPILSVLFLIGLFFAISVYLITIGLHFLGLVYLIVYVGAVSILFLFILMLINVRISELLTDNNNSTLLAILTVLCFIFSTQGLLPSSAFLNDVLDSGVLFPLLMYYNEISSQVYNDGYDLSFQISAYLRNISITITNSKTWDGMLVSLSHVTSIGNILYTNLVILFIMTSLILLIAMVGTIIITINKTKKIYK